MRSVACRSPRAGGVARSASGSEPALVELLEVCGLAGVLPGECQRDAEQREQPRVEEGVDPDDLAL